jgi:hypothetical protein
MYLDDLEGLNQNRANKRTPFQTFVMLLEIGLLMAFFILFCTNHRLFAIIALYGLTILYLFLPIPLFRSQQKNEHLWVHFAGFFTGVCVMTLATKASCIGDCATIPDIIHFRVAPFLLLVLSGRMALMPSSRRLLLPVVARFLIFWLLLMFKNFNL